MQCVHACSNESSDQQGVDNKQNAARFPVVLHCLLDRRFSDFFPLANRDVTVKTLQPASPGIGLTCEKRTVDAPLQQEGQAYEDGGKKIEQGGDERTGRLGRVA